MPCLFSLFSLASLLIIYFHSVYLTSSHVRALHFWRWSSKSVFIRAITFQRQRGFVLNGQCGNLNVEGVVVSRVVGSRLRDLRGGGNVGISSCFADSSVSVTETSFFSSRSSTWPESIERESGYMTRFFQIITYIVILSIKSYISNFVELHIRRNWWDKLDD